MAGETYEHERGCSRAREWASLGLDGELSELERLLLRRHLSRCEACRQFVESVTETTVAVRAAPLARPPRAVEPAPEIHRGRPLRYRVAAVAAAVAAGAIAGSLVVLSGNDDGLPSGPAPVTVIAILPDVEPATPVTQTEENV